MSLPLTRRTGSKPVHWTTILGLILVPLTVAGVLLWGLWNPTERLDSVTAAVVNQDEPVEVDGQLVPLGRVLAGELIGSGSSDDGGAAAGEESGSGSGTVDTNFTWVLTDADDAEAGLDDGRYATVVTIPENFSAAATSLSGGPDGAETAHIDIAESDRGRLIDTALSSIVTQTATGVLNQQLGAQFVGGVFVGMSELHSGLGDAADGASQLADGGEQLAEGATQLADGTQQLSDGTQQLSSGAGELSTGASQFATGVSELSTGAGELSAGASGLADGVAQYVGGASTLAQSYATLEQGTIATATQLKTLIGALGQLQLDSAEPQGQIESGMTAAGAGTAALGEDIGTLYVQCLASGAAQEFCDGMLGTLQTRATEIGGGLATAGTGIEGLGAAMQTFQETASSGQQPSGGDPIAQLDQLIAGAGDFGTGLDEFAAQGAALSSGASQLASGSAGLASGTAALSTGASGLADGASQLATGTAELAAGTPELAEGAAQLADGVGQSAEGTGELATGLGEAVSGIPNYSEAEREKLAETAVAPVEARGGSDELFNASGVPLFAGIALWAGALASFLVLAPLWRRTREAARGVGWIALRSAVPAVAIGATQGAIAGVVLPIALGYDLGRGAAFFGLALLAGIAFALVVQGLSALLGGFGRFIAFVLLVIAFAVGIVSTVPGALAAVGDASPLGSALAGFQAIATGGSGAGVAAVLLVLWGLGGLVLTAFAVARARKA
ncbi:YhgE/Pip domain-containing protein [Leucobacter celer]|jgi:putative membrane protein|uniref:YhgE/Pip domain-containing protein n=1 Tax=Leucobacter celer TaxID=668625 RepID=UPI0006A7E11B|nr:YhgE/Pip domain-containing protein [Leucobacter celer]